MGSGEAVRTSPTSTTRRKPAIWPLAAPVRPRAKALGSGPGFMSCAQGGAAPALQEMGVVSKLGPWIVTLTVNGSTVLTRSCELSNGKPAAVKTKAPLADT